MLSLKCSNESLLACLFTEQYFGTLMALSCALSHLLSQCGSLVGTGVSFPGKANNRRLSDCFWKTDPDAPKAWQLWSCSLLLLVGSGWSLVLAWLQSVGDGWWLWFRVFIGLVGVFWLIEIFSILASVFISGVVALCIFLLFASASTQLSWEHYVI